MQNQYSSAISSSEPQFTFNNQILRYITIFDSIIFFILFLLLLSKEKLKKPADIKAVTYQLQQNNIRDIEVNKILFKIRKAVSADRVVIGLFHSTNIISLKYNVILMTAFHESKSELVPSIKDKVKNIPLYKLLDEFRVYRQSKANKFISSLSDPNLSDACRQHLTSNNIETIANYLLVAQGIPFGILSIQFCTGTLIQVLEDIDVELNKYYKKSMSDFIKDVGDILVING